MISETTVATVFELSDGDRTVELRELKTPNGERLVVASGGVNIRLDALALESLTWQDDAFFADLTGEAHDEGDDPEAVDSEFQVGNEYTVIWLQRIETTAGIRLEVRSPKLGYSCRLSTAELAEIAGKHAGFFSELLRTPLGPEEEHHHGAH